MKEYEKFVNVELENMSKSQNAFLKEYETDSYSSWFYDQESELLRLYSENEKEIFFKYIPVGSYSLISKTWMWSWENKGSIESSKNETLIVKDLGEQNDYNFLRNGLFECDQSECWKLTAISKNLIGGIGVYCTNSKDLLKYIIIKEAYSDTNSNEVRKMKQKTVDCGVHGFSRPAYICQHLNVNESNGFEEAFIATKGMDLDDDDAFAAWCNECETIRIENDGWNDVSENFANIKLVCEDCYFELKEQSEREEKG